MSMTRHVGRLKNTGSRIAIVFRKLEDDPTSCLICEVERLPDLLHDNVMEIINSKIAQSTVNLYEALSRSQLNDGTNSLNTLHGAKYLRKVKISEVEAMPMPNRPVPLEQINEAIDNPSGANVDPVAEQVAMPDAPNEQVASATSDSAAIAQNLIVQAELMEADAQAKRQEAYKLNPELNPEAKPKPKATQKKKLASDTTQDKRVKSEAEKKATREAKNERRRQSYQASKEQSIDASLEAKVAQKIARDAQALGE